MKQPEVFKITEAPRTLPEHTSAGTYLVDLVRLVREGDHAKQAAEEKATRLQEKIDTILIQVADALFDLRRMLERDDESRLTARMRALSQPLEALLQNSGVTIEEPTGQILQEALHQKVELHGWLPSDDTEERVHETIAPIVLRAGRVIRPGRVIGLSRNANNKPEAERE
ncbi:MAG: hypothetical protein ACE5IY_16950 [bacterium]